jgi:hypothetical protein
VARKGTETLERLCEAYGKLDSSIDPNEIVDDGYSPH